MAQQLSLFGSPEPEEALVKLMPAAASVQPKPAPEPIAAYASVVLDIPTRALSEPFAYCIPQSLVNEAQIGSTVLVHFGNRAAAGYVVDIAPELGDLQGNNALDPARIKAVEAILSKPLFTAEAARIARWMSHEYVATLSECLRLFLPPGAVRVWSRVTTACGRLNVQPSNPSKIAGLCSRPKLRLYAAQDRGPPAPTHRGAPVRPGHDARPQPSL